MPEYVLGVDGGGTKSHLALFDTEGNLVDFVRWGPLNHECLPGRMEQLREELAALIGGTLAKNNVPPTRVIKSVLGVAGVDTKREQAVISELVAACGLTDFVLCNDAFLSVKAGSPTGWGVCAINGTGYAVAGIDPKGGMIQVGGHGHLTAERGGAWYYTETAIGAVYAHLFMGAPPTLLKDLFQEKIPFSDDCDFIEAVADGMADGSVQLGPLNRVVFEAAGRGDAVALGILRESGRNYGLAIGGAIRRLQFPEGVPIDIVLAGSVHVKGEHPAQVDALKEEAAADAPRHPLRFSIFDKPPVAGAVLWALEGLADRAALIPKVCGQL